MDNQSSGRGTSLPCCSYRTKYGTRNHHFMSRNRRDDNGIVSALSITFLTLLQQLLQLIYPFGRACCRYQWNSLSFDISFPISAPPITNPETPSGTLFASNTSFRFADKQSQLMGLSDGFHTQTSPQTHTRYLFQTATGKLNAEIILRYQLGGTAHTFRTWSFRVHCQTV